MTGVTQLFCIQSTTVIKSYMTVVSGKPHDLLAIISGKSAYYSRHPKWSQNWLISVQLVLLCMFQTILLMGNCSWLS